MLNLFTEVIIWQIRFIYDINKLLLTDIGFLKNEYMAKNEKLYTGMKNIELATI